MHSRELVELAAVVAVNGQALVRKGSISNESIEQYWSASKARLDHWSQSLREYLQLQIGASPLISAEGPLVLAWREVRPVVEEILVGEVLTRVWTSLACLYFHSRSRGLESVVRSVYIGHLEARNRALNVLVYGRGFSTREAVELNALRRRCERWCDLLLGYLVDPNASQPTRLIAEFAIEPERVCEFARDLLDDGESLAPLPGELLQSSLRAAFDTMRHDEAANAVQNRAISDSIRTCFPGQRLDFCGPAPTGWLDRIASVTADAELMIEELLAIEGLFKSQVGRRHFA